ncbi:hypothetical protein [Prosthecobacter vanneervenii]|uniref:Quinol:cytochrome c oxidoreductase quinone-binding subunit 2 n=1 Tax=Prosthecobacter vanneervenii TaxID=48466 RepID=A0A7W7YE69_9BACT|nr:hypothetical protein [Prosthecobacter vanneervenii]MBB5034552.1 hypothetical protein [Prosthecobacter vanneervenii]
MSHHVTFKDLPQGGEKFETAKGGKLINAFLVFGLLGLAASIYYFVASTNTFAYSWLFAVFFAFTFVVGGCFWILLHSVSNSGWGVSVRRIWENMANMIIPMALFAIPLLFPAVQTHLYEWMNHHREAAHHASEHGSTVKEALHHMAEANPHLHVLVSKFGYMNLNPAGFSWYTRFFAYFLILWFIASTLRGRSLKQEQDGDIKHTIWSRQFSSIVLLPFALTVTFAAYDWLVGLDYNWFSTMWGVYIFAGCAWASMAASILVITWLRSLGYLQKVVTEEHYHLMGKLLFAFTVFWAYIAFSQYFLIWYANVTEETRFYLTRNTEGWRALSIFIVIGHFVAPFVFLLSQPRKKNPVVMSLGCIWILFMHLVDMYWNVIPERGPSLGQGVWVAGAWVQDLAALCAVFGIMGYLYLRGLAKYSLYPWRDPRLIESVNVIN